MKLLFLLAILLTSCAPAKTRVMDPEEEIMREVQQTEGGILYRSVNWEVKP